MSNKISHARIAELEAKKSQLQDIKNRIEQTHRDMSEIRARMSDDVVDQLFSSSTMAQMKRKAEVSNLKMKGELDALQEKIDELTRRQDELQQQIELLQGWG